MVDDCALGDLLLDPVSVRCEEERKAMKVGGEQMEDRAVHRKMKKGERGKEMNSVDESKEKDEKDEIMQGSTE